jgi:hypothetical protein
VKGDFDRIVRENWRFSAVEGEVTFCAIVGEWAGDLVDP